MRIATVTMQQQGVNAILDRQAEMSQTEIQLATGRKILRPSDDPVNSAVVLNLKDSIATTEQYLRNADMVTSSLSLQEATLEGVTENIQRARELALQGISGTNSSQSRRAIAMELRQIRAAVFNLANTRDEQGEYIFAGSKTPTAPGPFKSEDPRTAAVTFEGNDSNRQVPISVGQQIISRDSGVDVFGDFSSGDESDLFSTLGDLAEWLDPADPDNPQVASSNGLVNQLDQGIERVLTVQSKIGARMNMIERHREVEERFIDKLKDSLSNINDVDFAEAISDFNMEQVGMQAAQQAYTKIQGLSLFDYLR